MSPLFRRSKQTMTDRQVWELRCNSARAVGANLGLRVMAQAIGLGPESPDPTRWPPEGRSVKSLLDYLQNQRPVFAAAHAKFATAARADAHAMWQGQFFGTAVRARRWQLEESAAGAVGAVDAVYARLSTLTESRISSLHALGMLADVERENDATIGAVGALLAAQGLSSDPR